MSAASSTKYGRDEPRKLSFIPAAAAAAKRTPERVLLEECWYSNHLHNSLTACCHGTGVAFEGSHLPYLTQGSDTELLFSHWHHPKEI